MKPHLVDIKRRFFFFFVFFPDNQQQLTSEVPASLSNSIRAGGWKSMKQTNEGDV